MTKKRSHKNTTRLTAKERAFGIMEIWGVDPRFYPHTVACIQRVLRAHARAALRRKANRA